MKKKVKNGNRYCQKCGHKLQKYGLTKDGGQKNGVKSQKNVNPETSEIWFTHARLRPVAFNLGKLILL